MSRPAIDVVWFKRDLRTRDHAPLHAAEGTGRPTLLLLLSEPSMRARPDFDGRHLGFQLASVRDLNDRLASIGHRVHVVDGEAVDVFDRLTDRFEVRRVLSHQESGIRATWDRDKAVARLLRDRGVQWTEYQRDGVERGRRDRRGWDAAWFARMARDVIPNDISAVRPFPFDLDLPGLAADQIDAVDATSEAFQTGGETAAHRTLHSFLQERCAGYHRRLSKPVASRRSCSRLSPHLAWGTLSIRQAVQAARRHAADGHHKGALRAFRTRLKWHCHFIQKFEMEVDYEDTCVNRGFELLEHANRPGHVDAWLSGQTGIPMVDANMRCVQATGWINFRMRAMLVSFLCHHLDCDWRLGVHHLARAFLDYEPGIHYPQFQMQAGVTGINTVRMYNPVKQGHDHDPDGNFVRTWVPELRDVPDAVVHTPWAMTTLEQAMCGVRIGSDYPAPIVDVAEAARAARTRIWSHRNHPAVRRDARRILATHTRRTRTTDS